MHYLLLALLVYLAASMSSLELKETQSFLVQVNLHAWLMCLFSSYFFQFTRHRIWLSHYVDVVYCRTVARGA